MNFLKLSGSLLTTTILLTSVLQPAQAGPFDFKPAGTIFGPPGLTAAPKPAPNPPALQPSNKLDHPNLNRIRELQEGRGLGPATQSNPNLLNQRAVPGIPMQGLDRQQIPQRIEPGGAVPGGPQRVEPGQSWPGGPQRIEPGETAPGGPQRIGPGETAPGGPERIGPGSNSPDGPRRMSDMERKEYERQEQERIQAEKEHQRQQQEEQEQGHRERNNNNSGSNSDKGTDKPEGGKIDKYQPAEGSGSGDSSGFRVPNQREPQPFTGGSVGPGAHPGADGATQQGPRLLTPQMQKDLFTRPGGEGQLAPNGSQRPPAIEDRRTPGAHPPHP